MEPTRCITGIYSNVRFVYIFEIWDDKRRRTLSTNGDILDFRGVTLPSRVLFAASACLDLAWSTWPFCSRGPEWAMAVLNEKFVSGELVFSSITLKSILIPVQKLKAT